MNKTVLIFHSPLAEDAPADELDVLDEALYFETGLRQLGYETITIPFPSDLDAFRVLTEKYDPPFLVNLVETFYSSGKLVHLASFLMEHHQIPFTGCGAHALYLSSHKILSKQHMISHGIPTPGFYGYTALGNAAETEISTPFLIKSLWEHASFGLDESKKLLFDSKKELLEQFGSLSTPHDFFCEEYIHGREFNLSVIEQDGKPVVLPVAEIRFGFPDNKPHILGYKAKWDEDSFEYKHTVRSFDFDSSDTPLLSSLREMARKCWEIFELRGYARVDFRVDRDGNIFVLEINANPCISPDSGFVAAAGRAGLDCKAIIGHIVAAINGKKVTTTP